MKTWPIYKLTKSLNKSNKIQIFTHRISYSKYRLNALVINLLSSIKKIKLCLKRIESFNTNESKKDQATKSLVESSSKSKLIDSQN